MTGDSRGVAQTTLHRPPKKITADKTTVFTTLWRISVHETYGSLKQQRQKPSLEFLRTIVAWRRIKGSSSEFTQNQVLGFRSREKDRLGHRIGTGEHLTDWFTFCIDTGQPQSKVIPRVFKRLISHNWRKFYRANWKGKCREKNRTENRQFLKKTSLEGWEFTFQWESCFN